MRSSELIRRISSAPDDCDAWQSIRDADRLPHLDARLTQLLDKHGISALELCHRVSIERSALYRMLHGERHASRNVLLRIALAAQFSLEETQSLLQSGRRCALTPRDRRDVAVIFAIQHDLSLAAAEELLLRRQLGSLYDRT